MQGYDDAFYDYVQRQAGSAARLVVDLLRELLPVGSVVDFGCGRGIWLDVWKQAGVSEVLGVDGDYVRRDALRIAPEEFRAHDLRQPLALGRRFDLVQSLEVAEHLAERFAAPFVDMLCAHGDVVLFAAAVPGQGGEHHVNEQPYEYWRELFARHGYVALDPVRPRLRRRSDVPPWYRYNLLLYVARPRLEAWYPRLAPFVVAEGRPIPDVSPWPYRLRKGLLRHVPPRLATRLAQAKKHLALGRRPA